MRSPPVAPSPAARMPGRALQAERPLLSGARLAPGGVSTGPGGLRAWMNAHPFTAWVLFPTLLAGIYFFVFAAPQYLSEARFTVRSQMPRAQQNMLGEVLGTAGFIASPENIASVRDFLVSHDAVRGVRREIDLVEVFRRPEADVLSRLWWAAPTAERLRWFFRWQVTITIDASTGISDLRVWTFRPTDSEAVARRLLTLGEELVNDMNLNIREEALRAGRIELERAESRILQAQSAVTAFRQQERMVDPNQSATMAVSTIGQLDADAARLRSDLQALQSFARPNNPQIQNMLNRIQGLEAQAATERGRLAAAGTGITEQIATYTRLQGQMELAAQQLAAARITLDRANADAQRQQIFLLRVVEPNLAERSLFPLPYWTTLYVFLSLSLLYSLAWLLLAGMREHAR